MKSGLGNERRRSGDRRGGWDRRRDYVPWLNLRTPGWPEQRIQFLTRYLFIGLGLAFFNRGAALGPGWLTAAEINTLFLLYFFLNSALFLHAWRQPQAPLRYRVAMWVDLAMVTVAVVNDPYDLPPSLLVYIMVVLGNGMRYGIRLFAEAVIGCFVGAMVALSLRHSGSLGNYGAGLFFLNLFGGIILVYAYILMSRVELSRIQSERNSRLDTLTGLLNRRGLEEGSQALFRRLKRGGGSLVVMMADLDDFKAVNDTLGHLTGDKVLVQFARVLRSSLRGSDLAARYGGDEFVLVLPDTSLDQAEIIARRIQQIFNHWTASRRISCGVTIGMGDAPRQGAELASVLEPVDRALYLAKSRDGGGLERAAADALAVAETVLAPSEESV